MKFEIHQQSEQPQLYAEINGQMRHLPALWLRERAPTADQIDALTQQRFINPHQFDENLALTAVTLGDQNVQIRFTDGYQADYSHQHLDSYLHPPPLLPARKRWRADLNPIPRFRWSDIQSPSGHLQAVTAFLEYGFIIMTDTEREKQTIRMLAAHFGYVRETNFGDLFEVFSKPNPNDLAYQPVALGPHTDNPYREPTPGIQLLHCLVNETSGGLSTLVDSLACLDALSQTNPQGLELLADISVRFAFDDSSSSIAIDRPILVLDLAGQVSGLHYSPRLDWLPLLEEKPLRAYHRARKQLAALFSDSAFELQFRLADGECMMFDNNRVLHGRTAYDPNEGRRHLQGCYIDRDGPESHYRRMCRDGVRVG